MFGGVGFVLRTCEHVQAIVESAGGRGRAFRHVGKGDPVIGGWVVGRDLVAC